MLDIFSQHHGYTACPPCDCGGGVWGKTWQRLETFFLSYLEINKDQYKNEVTANITEPEGRNYCLEWYYYFCQDRISHLRKVIFRPNFSRKNLTTTGVASHSRREGFVVVFCCELEQKNAIRKPVLRWGFFQSRVQQSWGLSGRTFRPDNTLISRCPFWSHNIILATNKTKGSWGSSG